MESLGIVHDGKGLRFMSDCERVWYRQHSLPAGWVLIIPPATGDGEGENESDRIGTEAETNGARLAPPGDELAASRL